jgi:DNA topoisomerase-3
LERLHGGHRLGKAYVDRTKLTDHHAILPTGKRPSPGLTPALRKIYDLVVSRFVGVFLPDQVVEETVVTLDIGGAAFVAKGSVVLKEGWKQVEPGAVKGENAAGAEDSKGEDGRQALPPLDQGQTVQVRRMEVLEKEEFGQLAIPSRTFDLTDLGWSYVGIVVFGLPAVWLRGVQESAI